MILEIQDGTILDTYVTSPKWDVGIAHNVPKIDDFYIYSTDPWYPEFSLSSDIKLLVIYSS